MKKLVILQFEIASVPLNIPFALPYADLSAYKYNCKCLQFTNFNQISYCVKPQGTLAFVIAKQP